MHNPNARESFINLVFLAKLATERDRVIKEEIWLPVSTFEHYEVSNRGGLRHQDVRPIKQRGGHPPSVYTNDEGERIARLYAVNPHRVQEIPLTYLVRTTFHDVDIDTI